MVNSSQTDHTRSIESVIPVSSQKVLFQHVVSWLCSSSARWVLLALVSVVLTFPQVMYPISSGLDSSGGFAMNYAFAHGWIFGKQIVHSYGPLGFAVSPNVLGHNVAWGLLIQVATKVTLALSLMRLAQLAKTPEGRFWHNGLNVVLIVYLLAMCTLEWALMLSVLSSTLIAFGAVHSNNLKGANQNENISRPPLQWRWWLTAVGLTVMAGLIKPGFGVVTAGMLGCGSVLFSIQVRRWQPLAVTVLALFALLAVWWLLLYHTLSGLPEFLTSVVMAAKGYSAAHTQNPPNNWLLWGLFFVSLFWFPRWEKNTRVNWFYGTAILATLMYWKYSMVRQDHILMFFNWLMIFYGALVLYSRVLSWRLIVNVALTFLLLIGSMTASGFNHIKLLGLKQSSQGLPHFIEWVQFGKTVEHTHQETANALAVDVLDDELKARLQTEEKTVGIYPWEASMVAANHLAWKPRPAFQSHMVVGPYFDQRNQTALEQESLAPDVMLWERDHRAGPVGSIDGRYLLNDDPLTLQQMMSHYALTDVTDKVAVWERTDDMPYRFESVHEENSVWGQWISVPAIEPGSVVVLKVVYHPSFVQKIKRALYKENDSYIEYQLLDGSIQKHRLYTDNMRNGLWVNPYVTRIGKPLVKGEPVLAVRLTHSPSDGFADELNLTWVIGNPSR